MTGPRLFYAYNTHNFYIKQYCYESTSKVDKKTVIFYFFLIFRIKSRTPAYVIVYTLNVEKDFQIYAFNKKICMSENNRVWSVKQDDSRIPLKLTSPIVDPGLKQTK